MVELVFAFVHRAVVFDVVLHTLLVDCKPWSIHKICKVNVNRDRLHSTLVLYPGSWWVTQALGGPYPPRA